MSRGRDYTHDVSRAWLPEQNMSKDDTNRLVNMKGKSHRAPALDEELQAN